MHYNCQIIIYPELVSASFNKREADLFILWNVLKGIDCSRNKSGLFYLSEVIKIASDILNVSRSQIYSKIRKGVGKYWSNKKGVKGHMRFTIYSTDTVINYLSSELAQSQPYIACYDDLMFENWNKLKSYLICLIAARHSGERPIKIQSIADNLGVSISTVKRNIVNNKLQKIENVIVISSNKDINILYAEKQSKKEPFRYKIIEAEDKFHLLFSLPNSYIIPDINRLSIRKRPIELKQNKYIFEKSNIKSFYNNSDNLSKRDVNKSIFVLNIPLIKVDGIIYNIWQYIK